MSFIHFFFVKISKLMTTNLILTGIVIGAHGLQGHVIVKSFTEPTVNFTKLALINELQENIKIKFIRQNPNGNLICKFSDTNDRTQAEYLKGYKFFCMSSALPPADEDEFYIEQLKDLEVLDQNHQFLGKIINMFNFGAGDMLEVDFSEGESELFPFTKEFFPVITKEHIILNRLALQN